MNKKQAEILEQYLKIDLSDNKIKLFEKYEELFLEKNSHTNLISKNDEKFLFEKHIFDSLAINKFFEKYKIDLSKNEKPKSLNLLDIGTGGGFPAVPIAILYDNISVLALDSIRKKINLINEIKTNLNLKNLFTLCDRAENLPLKKDYKAYDYATKRAVAPISVIIKYAMVNLKVGGYFIAYKSKKALEEMEDAKKTIKLLKANIVDIIEYDLPLEENYERNLIIFQKGK